MAKAAADYGTYIEINAKKIHLSEEELEKILKTDARFILSSDAHPPDRVGEVSLALKVAEAAGVPADRIDNVDGRTPNFRFAAFKSAAGRS